MRFADRYSDSFQNEGFGGPESQHQTAPQCHERYVSSSGPPLRAVVCMTAYKKLQGLYVVSALVATLDSPRIGVQGRFDARGVSFDNALKLTRHYLEGYGWSNGQTSAP